MRILAFDTATDATAVALSDPAVGLQLELRDDPSPGERPGHATRLLSMIADLLARADGGWEAVGQIAVGIGPGSFTGLRIGIATARALALARELPLVGISSLHALATGAVEAGEGRDGGRAVLAVIDARRGEAFAAAWRGPHRELDPCALGPEVLAIEVARLGGAGGAGDAGRLAPLAIGDGALRFRSLLEVAGAGIPPDDSMLHRISAVNHCRLAAGLPAAFSTEVEPVYLRAPDAEIAHRKLYPEPT
jgi:tRNA threonylcarbamoyladenosine biosynthesis protein TsaB